MESRTPWRCSAGLVLALGCASAFAGTPVQGNFRVSVRVPPSPSVAIALLDTVPTPPGAQRLTRNETGDSYWIERDPESVSRLYRETMRARGYRLQWQSDDGRMSTWQHARHRVDLEVREVIGTHPASRVVVQATPTS